MMKLGFTKKRSRALGGLALFLTLVLGPLGSAFAAPVAQEITGSIQGEVKDQAGAVVPNATVTAASAQRNFKATTDKEGLYRFNSLQPGVYTVTASAKGFSDAK